MSRYVFSLGCPDFVTSQPSGRKEGNALFNDTLKIFYLWLYGVGHMVKDLSDSCRQMGYSFRLAAKVLLYASSHRQDNTYHDLCYTSCGALAGTRNSSMGQPSDLTVVYTGTKPRQLHQPGIKNQCTGFR